MTKNFKALAEAMKEVNKERENPALINKLKCFMGLHDRIFSSDIDNKAIKICRFCGEVKKILWNIEWSDYV